MFWYIEVGELAVGKKLCWEKDGKEIWPRKKVKFLRFCLTALQECMLSSSRFSVGQGDEGGDFGNAPSVAAKQYEKEGCGIGREQVTVQSQCKQTDR